METSLMEFISLSALIAVITAIAVVKISKSGKKLPPSPWKLPVIGHLHHLVGAPPHHALRKLSQKYGGLVHLQLGELSSILVSSPRFAKEVMKTQDLAFASRAEFLGARILWYNHSDIAFTPYGEYWKQMRKICTSELLSAARVRSFEWIRQEEVMHFISSIKILAASAAPINLTEKVGQCTSSMVVRAAFGNVNKDDQYEFLDLIKEALPLISSFDISDVFPSLRFIHPLLSVESKLMKIRGNMDRVLDNIINQHLENLERSKAFPHSTCNEDLIDVLLRVKESSGLEIPIIMDNIKAVLLDVFVGGTDTTSNTVEWAMSEMIRNPEIMGKAQSEIRKALGGKETIEEADIQQLSYLKFVVKETLRLHPPAPLLIPRESRQQCKVDGYEIPAKFRVIINAWAIARDPECWEDADMFIPERFEKNGIDFSGSNFEFIPFGAGRRICAGMSLGLANIYLPLALLLFHFNWKLPNGLNPADLDMSETVSIAASRTNHLVLLADLYHPSLQT